MFQAPAVFTTMGSQKRCSIALDSNNNTRTTVIPDRKYWVDRLICKGCSSPLFAPVYYCQGNHQLHLLCQHCTHCAIKDCKSKISQQRCYLIEKILRVVSFVCEYQCKKGPFEGKEYNVHTRSCHLRPLLCYFCKTAVSFRGYVNHLAVQHGMTEARLQNGKNLLLNFSRGGTGQQKMQYVVFNGSTFLIHYEGGKLWVEAWSEDENAENDYRVHASGVKYLLDFQLQILNVRHGREIIREILRSDEARISSAASIYAVPPPNEELSLQFIHEGGSKSSPTFNGDMEELSKRTAYV